MVCIHMITHKAEWVFPLLKIKRLQIFHAVVQTALNESYHAILQSALKLYMITLFYLFLWILS